MHTDVLTPMRVFALPQHLVVPLFQRPYVWDEREQWQPLWQDVRRMAELRLAMPGSQGTHFLGAVVLQAQDAPHGAVAVKNVIDGQQRLTTVQLLMDSPAPRASSPWSAPRTAGTTHAGPRRLPISPNPASSSSPPRRSRSTSACAPWPSSASRSPPRRTGSSRTSRPSSSNATTAVVAPTGSSSVCIRKTSCRHLGSCRNASTRPTAVRASSRSPPVCVTSHATAPPSGS